MRRPYSNSKDFLVKENISETYFRSRRIVLNAGRYIRWQTCNEHVAKLVGPGHRVVVKLRNSCQPPRVRIIGEHHKLILRRAKPQPNQACKWTPTTNGAAWDDPEGRRRTSVLL